MNFASFIASPLRNAWLVEPGIKLYVRRSIMSTHGDYELANLRAFRPGYGALTKFLDKYEPRFQFYIENIFEPRLIPFFQRRGYVFTKQDEPPCMLGRAPEMRIP